jgi:hypothetical protein
MEGELSAPPNEMSRMAHHNREGIEFILFRDGSHNAVTSLGVLEATVPGASVVLRFARLCASPLSWNRKKHIPGTQTQ